MRTRRAAAGARDVERRALGPLRRLLWHPESKHVFRLPTSLEALCDRSDALADPEALHHELGDFDLEGEPPAAREAARHAHTRYLFMALPSVPESLGTLAETVPHRQLLPIVEDLLSREISSTTGLLVEQLRASALPYSPAVEALLGRLRPTEHHPVTAHAAARYLFHHGMCRDDAVRVVLAFAAVDQVSGYEGNPFHGELALLALELVPEHALDLVRRALRCPTPLARNQVAAALVVLGHRWCAEELVAALPRGGRWTETAEIRAALTRLDEPTARMVAKRWWDAHGPPPHAGPGHSWDEVAEASRDGFLDDQILHVRPRLEPLRARLTRLPEP